ncbi:MAG: hypothetical protein IPQ05_09930 [Leptospiraceae bacterium]|nr:hypothetical protein [Leptospiraceae bacterium]
MKLNKNILTTILLGGLLIGLSLLSQEEVGNRFLLPEDFKVYAGNHGVVNHPVQGLTEKPHNTKSIPKNSRLLYRLLFPRFRKGNLFCWRWNLRHGTNSSKR